MEKGILITGSTKGIGRATALNAIKQGWFVFINYSKDDKAAEDISSELISAGYQNCFRIIKADASNTAGIEVIKQAVQESDHELRGMVLNASSNGTVRHTFGDITPEEMETMFQRNLFGPFFLVQELSEAIKPGGAIVFVSSHVGIYPHSTYIPYGLTKSAEIFLSKMLVKEFEGRNITVNVVAPAFIETEMFPGNRSQDHLDSIRSKIAVHRFGRPEEVAEAIMSLVGNPYINGAVLSVDGGYDYR